MIRVIFIAIVFIVACLGCGREKLESYDENFRGTWNNRDTLRNSAGVLVTCYLRVDGDNSEIAMLCDHSLACWQTTSGKVFINKKHTKMTIGDNPKFRYDINQLPFLNSSGQWQCTIEGIVMIRD